MPEEKNNDGLEPINNATDILIYSIQALIGVRRGTLTFKQYYRGITDRWEKYNENNILGKDDSISKLTSYDHNPLYKRIARAASNYQLAMNRDDYDAHYVIALSHTIFLSNCVDGSLSTLEERLTTIDNEKLKQQDITHLGYTLKEIMDIETYLINHYVHNVSDFLLTPSEQCFSQKILQN